MKECFYSILELDRKADDDCIKKAYRRLALLHHPDKQVEENREMATIQFQLIAEAYEVLSDKQERAWYDSHRDQILHSGDSASSGAGMYSTKEDIWRYFTSQCFNGKFDDSEQGFYRVYGDLFEELSRLEADDVGSDDEHDGVYPSFGMSGTEFADVSIFYANWTSFSTFRSFTHFDKWNPRDAENRQVRRAMDVENKKARNAARREYSSAVRSLVAYVKRRDKRVAENSLKQRSLKEEKLRTETVKLERLREAQRIARETAREEEERRWEEIDRIREIDVIEEEEEIKREFVCIACRKNFKSEPAFESHERSKKHKQVIVALRRELMLDDESTDTVIVAPRLSVPTVTVIPRLSVPTVTVIPTSCVPTSSVPTSSVPTSSIPVQRKPRRRAKEERVNSFFACKNCGSDFPSKSALFKHLDSEGHHTVSR